ncbi:cell division protein FtsZ [Methyloceanibacter methanicus]|uniref:Cell division protein FtsZ n=1 Tax=Methyloceanibacter methanicus TaxID=1774968 RepID=A0A1E3VX65_9HYPH|nr:cell division protein FtsZ [Methyloceanibacter methanicus]ODR98113.1 cell division protein FtsZ [Methyloceanibacter methanicus]
MTINLKVPDLTELKPRITVFGVGGAGGNAVNNMIERGLNGVEFVVANTDAQALTSSSAERRIQMGNNVTEGLGAGSKPEIGAAAAEEAMADIKAHLVGCHMTFITAGMGGGTGTGAAPVIARASREEGILTVGVVTKPFQFEGSRRMRAAEAGIEELQKYVDTLLIIPNQNLFRVANEKTTFTDAFGMADDVLRSGVGCITDLMVKEGLINLDFADVRTIMAGMGKAMMGTGEANGERRAIDAAEAAISNPLLDDVCMKGSSGLLVSITGGSDLTLYEVDEAASRIRAEADEDANIIVGATYDDELDGMIRVSVVATGIGTLSEEKSSEDRAAQPQADRGRLTERLAGLATVPNGNPDEPVDLDESLMVPEPAQDAQVWHAPNDVTIEKRPQAVSGVALPRPPAPPKPAEAPRNFQPAPPAAIKRPVRRMPNVEELPIVAQKALQAKAGDKDAVGLHAQKRKVGFLERLANVGRGKNDEDAEMSPKMEPDFAPTPVAGRPAPRPPAPPAAVAHAQVPQAQAPRSLSVQRPPEQAPAPQRLEAQPRVVHGQAAMAVAQMESPADDDLEIPAFLRRRAN